MSATPREFFTVDLRGLRAALSRRATEAGITESDVLRSALAVALGDGGGDPLNSPAIGDASASQPQVKLSVRITCPAAERLDSKARAAGLSRGAYLAGLIARRVRRAQRIGRRTRAAQPRHPPPDASAALRRVRARASVSRTP